jgi:hypothetical protein
MYNLRKNGKGSIMVNQSADQAKAEKHTHHHYQLAHVALRQICLHNPYGFFSVMASPDRKKFLDDIWSQICARCDPEGPASFTPDDLQIITSNINDYPTILIQMPEPLFSPEAYFVGIVLLVKMNDYAQHPPDPVARYFTLERGQSVSGGVWHVLCEWQDGRHCNYGAGPEPRRELFVEAVKMLLEKPAS